MASMEIALNSLAIFLCLFSSTRITTIAADGTQTQRKTYIVYMGDVPEQATITPAEHHHSILMEAIGDEALARESRLHSYGRSLYGFAANLLPTEAARLREHEEIVSVFPSTTRKLMTTRSWDFLGLTGKRAHANLKVESNIIVAVLDTGIDIGAPSFNDQGYGPVPAKWKGKCEPGPDFPGCNRKVIGAQWYNVGKQDKDMNPTPYDYEGHGSHTASTAAGNTVPGASLYGVGRGTARGGLPHARIAMYRVCGGPQCLDENILAAFDDAIADGVDVISVSLGGGELPFYEDVCSIGSFHAMKRGIPVAFAGGNSGPDYRSVENVAPWMFTVAATNLDRDFVTKVRLGNGEEITGVSINTFVPPNKMLPLITGSSTQNSSAPANATICDNTAMIEKKVKGKIVLCYDTASDYDIQLLGGAGTLLAYDLEFDIGFAYAIPAAHVTSDIANRVTNYIHSTKYVRIDIGAPSFNDQGYGPVPAKWKGKCEPGPDFPGCNRKVIGAQWYNVGKQDKDMNPTPYDYEGHGSHTASTAAGNTVPGSSLYGVGRGTARGGLPHARIAMYRVCGGPQCLDENILAAFDDAIADGVDVISVSLGGGELPFYEDVCSIGSFHAMKRGIPVAFAGGNSGPDYRSVENVAPWMFTVAATNLDRDFVTKVRLGNGEEITGVSINTFVPPNKMLPLITGSSTQNSSTPANATICDNTAMIEKKVKGKIVLCYDTASDYDIQLLGGAGTLLAYDLEFDIGFAYAIPAAHVTSDIANRVTNYIHSDKNPTAMILQSTRPMVKAPVVASYSSRGPQAVVLSILKPDISAPGTDILAAYSKVPSMTGQEDDKRHGNFNILSGTSMATPHVAGALAYVKMFHPDWSPAVIKSAIMTTARAVNVSGPERPLSSGSGLIDPVRAVHPGLVYDITPIDYVRYLCREGYNSSAVSTIWGGKKLPFNCSDHVAAPGYDGINYPSMHMQLPVDRRHATVVYHRTVTYVGLGPSVFEAKVHLPDAEWMSVKVSPETLSFSERHEKKSFEVEVRVSYKDQLRPELVGFLEWSSSKYSVRSPIVVFRLPVA